MAFSFWNLLICLFVFYLYFLHGFSRPSETSKAKAGRVFSVLCSNGKFRAIKGSLISIYCALVYPYLTYGCVLWGNNYKAPLSQLVRLQNKVVRIINNVPLCDHITPHYVNLGLIKLPDIVKLYTCQLFYDHLIDKTSSNLNLSLVSEQHNYATRSASLQHLNPEYFRINMKFCPTILGCYYWNDIPLCIRNKPTRKLFKKALYQFYFAQY